MLVKAASPGRLPLLLRSNLHKQGGNAPLWVIEQDDIFDPSEGIFESEVGVKIYCTSLHLIGPKSTKSVRDFFHAVFGFIQ